MFYFKSCPKCHGDLYTDADIFGTYISCMQCSRYLTDGETFQLTQSILKPGWHLGLPADAGRLAA